MLKKLKEELDALRACGVEVDWLSVAVSDSGSYRAEHVIDYLEKTLLPWGSGRRWRILMLDAYRAHLVEAVRRLAWSRGYVVIYQGGGCTGISQVNDTDQNETVDENVLCKVSKSCYRFPHATPGKYIYIYIYIYPQLTCVRRKIVFRSRLIFSGFFDGAEPLNDGSFPENTKNWRSVTL